jgi:hypothetical protein
MNLSHASHSPRVAGKFLRRTIMGAKTKLNTAYLNGSLIGGGLIGLCFQSMSAFVFATIFLIACGFYNRNIR